MRVVVITPKLNFVSSGGSTDEYDLMYRTLQDMGHTVAVVTTCPQANNIPHPLPYPVHEDDVHSFRQIGIQWGVLKLLRKYDAAADAFFVDGQVYLYGAGLYRMLGGKVPVVAYFNRELIAWPLNISHFFPNKQVSLAQKFKRAARFYLERFVCMPLANYLDVVCFSNPHLEEEYGRFGLRTDGKSFIYGDSFDYRGLMVQHGITEHSYRERNKTQGPFTIFYSSRMAPAKGFDVLLQAFFRLAHKDNFHLVLGGSGPEENLVRQMVQDLHLEAYVELPGWMTKAELYERLKQADIFVQAQWRREITSMSLMTALMFGLPSIVPAGGGLEWVAYKSALCFKDGDPADLAQKIEQLASDPRSRAELSAACYRRMDDPELDHRNRITLLIDTIQNLIEK